MSFLKRSKSQRARAAREEERTVESLTVRMPATQEKKNTRNEQQQSGLGRSKSASDRRTSTERPRTTNRIARRADGLLAVGDTIAVQEGGDTFNFPTPSPRFPPPKSATSRTVPSPLHGTSSIGVTLESPRRLPPNWGRTHTMEELPRSTDRTVPPARAQTTNTALLSIPSESSLKTPGSGKKRSRWRYLGGLFQRGQNRLTTQGAVPKILPEQTPGPKPAQARSSVNTPTSSRVPARSPASTSSHRSRTSSISRGMSRFEARAEADRASLMRRSPSLAVQTRSPDLRSSALGDIREAENKPSTTSEKHDSPMSVMAPRPIPRTPRLDLDIPNAQLERYSVMFEKLLEPRQSILERRQSKAKRTRPVRKDGLNMPNIDKSLPEKPPASYPDTPQRSATSPHPQRAPSLQIRVAKQQRTPAAEPVNATALPLQRPIKRSNTAPPAAASPIAPNFSRPKAQTFSTTVSDHSPISPLSAEDSLPPTPTTVTTVTDTDSIVQPFSRLEQSTPTTSRQYPNNEKASPIPAIPTLSSPASQAGPSHHVRPPYPSVTSPEDLERQIIQVSVARQVSVSNARRQVEEATATSKQPMRPRVVELGRYRKSTVVLIESADE